MFKGDDTKIFRPQNLAVREFMYIHIKHPRKAEKKINLPGITQIINQSAQQIITI